MADETKIEETTKEAAVQQETSEVETSKVPEETTQEKPKRKSSSKKKKVDEDEDAVANAATSSEIEEDEKIGDAETADAKAAVENAEKEESSKETPNATKAGKSVKQYKPEVEGASTKFFLFKNKRKEYQEIDDFLTLNVFKRLRVRFWVNDPEFDFDFREVQSHIKDYVYKTINTNRVDDVDVIDAVERSKYVLNTAYNAVDILVPYSTGTARLINGFKLMIKTMNAERKTIQYKLKIESCVSFTVDPRKEHEDTIMKGFAAASWMEGYGDKPIPKVFMKSGMYVDVGIEFDKHDISNANEILSVIRVKEYDRDITDQETIRYIMPFKSKFSLVTWQVIDFQSNGKLKVQRTLNRFRIRNVTVAGIVIPIGVYMSRRKDIISVSSFAKFFVDTQYKERKNANALETYCQLEPGTYELEQFTQDCGLIDEIFLKCINIEHPEQKAE